MNDRIYLSAPDITEAEEDGILAAFRSGWIAPLGPEVDAFEREIAEFTGREHAVALSSGTAALHLALLGVGARQGTVVLTSTMTFAATANAITYTGATPVFVDCDESGNMDPALLGAALEDQLAGGATVAAILPVDLLGKVADYGRISELAREYDIPLLSDAAESLGAVKEGRPAGSFGVAAAISFNGNKIMTTSGGGMLLTDDEAFAARARYLATQARQPVVHYEHEDIGYNYRLSNLLAGLGRVQLRRLPGMLERRRRRRQEYRALFAGLDGTEIFGGPDGADGGADHDNFWLTSVLVDETAAGWSAAGLQHHLARLNIEARPLWKPMHVQPVFSSLRSYVNGTSERLFARGISLPSGSVLTDDDFARIAAAITDFVESRRS
ncbi:DegT/DnrJ/EryC1/StrS family aminotransferase [Georgenia thermotolerans]|uniref:Aminotransferase class I/II-fold pyridoxal phosphate-dependent enzyme n=1 Tax=Georgenia thermotolerans TaxID=527326 RepID=A0A7J5USI8_9MICO|nr:aminotransferase class I/II-fold pyridoxal phosphate-dependent enzyme [Georgenia thermotolerans]KAE8765247.1 aminotransferase class I/II-fold pyridoxal phosphate-dependent enzyme [Georgenia thermotolerans]